MAMTSNRDFWAEPITVIVPKAEAPGINGNSLKIEYDAAPASPADIHAMLIGEEMKELFSSSAIEIIWTSKIMADAASLGLAIYCVMRMDDDYDPGVPQNGFRASIWRPNFFPGTALILERILAGTPSYLFTEIIEGETDVRMRMRSDDDGSDVRIQLEIYDGHGGWDERYINSFSDMSAIHGELGENGFVSTITAGPPAPVITAGDYGLLDDIIISENIVNPAAALTLPFTDGFEDITWEP